MLSSVIYLGRKSLDVEGRQKTQYRFGLSPKVSEPSAATGGSPISHTEETDGKKDKDEFDHLS